jgi:hypothetical protein
MANFVIGDGWTRPSQRAAAQTMSAQYGTTVLADVRVNVFGSPARVESTRQAS